MGRFGSTKRCYESSQTVILNDANEHWLDNYQYKVNVTFCDTTQVIRYKKKYISFPKIYVLSCLHVWSCRVQHFYLGAKLRFTRGQRRGERCCICHYLSGTDTIKPGLLFSTLDAVFPKNLLSYYFEYDPVRLFDTNVQHSFAVSEISFIFLTLIEVLKQWIACQNSVEGELLEVRHVNITRDPLFSFLDEFQKIKFRLTFILFKEC